MEFNKIAGAVLLAGLIAMFVGKVSTGLYGGGESHHGEVEHAKRGYMIEVADAQAADAASGEATEAVDIVTLLATADAVAGEKFFKKKCATCHTTEQGGKDKTGPNLWNVVNRAKASHGGFNYSKSMQNAGGSWDYNSLNAFLAKPKKFIPGTMMAFAGMKKDKKRADLIAYLRTLSPSPAPIK